MKWMIRLDCFLWNLLLRFVYGGVAPDRRFRNRPPVQHERDAEGRLWFTPPGGGVRMQVYDLRGAFEWAWALERDYR